jgi:hypothetical protein
LHLRVCNYNKFQDAKQEPDRAATGQQHGSDMVATCERHHDKNRRIEEKKNRKIEDNISRPNFCTENEQDVSPLRGATSHEILDHVNEDSPISIANPNEDVNPDKVIPMRMANSVGDQSKSKNDATNHETKVDASESKFEDETKTKRKRTRVEPDDGDQEIGKEWASWTKIMAPHIKADSKRYATAIAKVRQRMSMSHSDVSRVFEFVKADKFWKDKCFSPVSLLTRSKTNDLLKIENIINSATKDHRKYADVMNYARQRDAGLIKSASEELAF